jgi:membrane associated rhomboid family serine protease
MTDLRAARNRALAQGLALLALALVVSAVAAYLLLGPSVAAGWTAALVGLAIAGVAVVLFHRFPDAETRRLYPPGQLGIARVGFWWLAALSQAPAFVALTLLMDRS